MRVIRQVLISNGLLFSETGTGLDLSDRKCESTCRQ